MALSAGIVTGVIRTTGTNENKKIRENLAYAAESGLEVAKSYLKGKGIITQGDINKINEILENVLVDAIKKAFQMRKLEALRWFHHL